MHPTPCTRAENRLCSPSAVSLQPVPVTATAAPAPAVLPRKIRTTEASSSYGGSLPFVREWIKSPAHRRPSRASRARFSALTRHYGALRSRRTQEDGRRKHDHTDSPVHGIPHTRNDTGAAVSGATAKKPHIKRVTSKVDVLFAQA